jgi:F0F1-type ATP synthase assembly protein I
MRNMPFLFGIGFIAPLIDQMIKHFGLNPAGSPWSLILGLLIGGSWGVYAIWKTPAQ